MADKPQLLGYSSLLGDPPPVPSKWDRIKQALWETNLAAPIRGYYNLRNADPYTLYTDTGAAGQQLAADSFDAAGGITVGSMPMPKPANSLTMGIKAYHGSPHSFDKFSMDKIGTGEGAQAYGHGLYFAENEGVARGYRDTLKPGKGVGPEDTASRMLDLHGGDRDAAIEALRKSIDKANSSNAPYEDVQRLMEAKTILNTAPERASGSMYEVEINADPNAFLDWDKPLSEQPEAIRPALEKVIADHGIQPSGVAPNGKEWSLTGGEIYDRIATVQGGVGGHRNLATQYLKEEAGIPGIKYLDAGSRGKGVAHVQPMYKGKPYGDPIPATAWNQVDQLTQRYKDMGYDVEVQDLGTRNYVVFDDKLISIVRKYGIAGASAMLGYSVLDGATKAQAAELEKANAQYHGSNLGGGGW